MYFLSQKANVLLTLAVPCGPSQSTSSAVSGLMLPFNALPHTSRILDPFDMIIHRQSVEVKDDGTMPSLARSSLVYPLAFVSAPRGPAL